MHDFFFFSTFDARSVITWIILGVIVLVPLEFFVQMAIFFFRALDVPFCMARRVRGDNKTNRGEIHDVVQNRFKTTTMKEK